MRLHAVAVVVALLAGSSTVAAQATVADGVAALSRGEYQRAYDILRPLAEREPRGDAAAQFFLGSMFDAGLGVPRDSLRACAYYHRAGTGEAPLAMAAMRLHRAAFLKHGAEFFAECQMIGNLGFDHRFEPVTFDLGAGHSIAWSLRGATITYRGQTTLHPQQLATRGGAFLPFRHTPVETGGTPARVRHFVEAFVWQPAARSTWSLHWHLFEVAGADLIHVTSDDSFATSPARPGAAPTEDARRHVVVRRAADGRAEWAILAGPNARSELIESEEERRGARESAATRRAALDKVDWKRRFDARRLPSLAYASTEGCGDVFVLGVSSDRAEVIKVHADRQDLQLGTTVRTFDLARYPTSIAVDVLVSNQAIGDPVFCSDVIATPTDRETETWRAVSGRVTIELSPPGIIARSPRMYRATIRVDDAAFIDAAGRRHRQTTPIVLSAVVGSFGG